MGSSGPPAGAPGRVDHGQGQPAPQLPARRGRNVLRGPVRPRGLLAPRALSRGRPAPRASGRTAPPTDTPPTRARPGGQMETRETPAATIRVLSDATQLTRCTGHDWASLPFPDNAPGRGADPLTANPQT